MQNCVVHELESPILQHWLDLGKVILVDVREQEEFEQGVIPSCVPNSMSHFDPASLPPDPHKQTIFYCHGGRRSHAAAIKWAEHWERNETYHLKGGIVAWKQYRYPLVKISRN